MLRASIWALVFALAACSSDTKTPGPSANPSTAREPAPPADPEPPTSPTAPAKPETTPFEIADLVPKTPLVIELPAGFSAGDRSPDFARFSGPDFGVLVETPAEGATLRDERELVKTPAAEAFVDESWEGGGAIAYRAGQTIAAVVAFETLGVLCSGSDLDNEAEARAAIAACRSLRPASAKAP